MSSFHFGRFILRRVLVFGLAVIVCQTLLANEIMHLDFETNASSSITLDPVPETGPGKIGHGIRLPAGKSTALALPAGLTGNAGAIECWVRANAWDASDPGEVELITVSLGGGDGIRLVKQSGSAALRLSRRGVAMAAAPVYDWFPRQWIYGQAIAAHGWRLVTIVWDAKECRLFFDGTEAPRAAGRVDETYPDVRALRLGGAANKVEAGFDELRLHDAPLPQEKMTDRYLALYYNEYDYRPQRVTAAFVSAPPRLDGRVDEGEWTNAAGLCGLSELGERRIAKQIRVLCAYDQENLYLAFVVPYTGELDGTKDAPRDKHPGYSDNIEIFLDPSQELEPAYYQLVGNVFGAINDNLALDYAWDPAWEWKTRVDRDVWTAEARIPFKDLDRACPEDGHVWGANFTGARPWMHWSLASMFHSRKQFGHLVFDRRAPVVRIERLDTETPGILKVAYTLRNPSSQPIKAEAAIQVIPPGSIAAQLAQDAAPATLQPGETKPFTLNLDVGKVPKADFVFSVSADGRLVSYQHFAYDHTVPVATAAPAAKKKAAEKKAAPAKPKEEKRWSAEALGEEVLLREQWEGNALGVSDETLPPWPPIETEGNLLRVWGREMAYDGGLLPRRICSQSTELLAGPIRLVAEQKGRRTTLEQNSTNEFQIVQHGSGKVSFETAGALAGLSVRCRQTLEFDGMLRVDLTVKPDNAPVELDRFTLEVPLRREAAQYFHVIGNANQPPDTDVGLLPKEGLSRGFTPMVWLGTERVGLAWFSEEFRDWSFVDRENWIQVIPQGDSMILRIHFVSVPCAVKAAKTFTFGLQATPMRPRPEGWRKWHLSNKDEGTDGAIAWRWFWGPTSYCFSHDFDYVRSWVDENWKHKRPMMPISSLKYYAAFYLNCAARGMPPHPKDGFITPEYKLWGKEWEQSPYTISFGVSKEHHREKYALSSACIASSYHDYYVYAVHRMIEKAGINGLYLDQPLKACGNAAHGCGYVDCLGVWQGQYLIFSSREAMKRLRRLFQEKHGFTRIMFHMSNQILVPVVSLCDIFYDGETYNSGPLKVYDHYSKVIPLPRYRIQHSLQAFGPASMLMSEFMYRGDRLDSTREFVGYNLLHDCLGAYWMCVKPEGEHIEAVWRAFAGQEGVEYYPYWENARLLRVQPETVKVSFYRKDNMLFVVAVNTDPDKMQTAELSFTPEQLKLAGGRIARAEDAFTGAVLPVEGATLRLPVRNLDFRFVQVQFGE